MSLKFLAGDRFCFAWLKGYARWKDKIDNAAEPTWVVEYPKGTSAWSLGPIGLHEEAACEPTIHPCGRGQCRRFMLPTEVLHYHSMFKHIYL